jgi:16S rRNA U1498 N3-methylase RsmE
MDESQAFWEKRTLPRPLLRKCARLNLEKSYRCPPGIQALAEGFKPTDIAVISLRGRMFDRNIMHCTELGGRPIVQATDDRAKEHIVCDTFLRYKGLERLAVIVTDLCRDSEKYGVRMNIAISRAVGILRIIGTREEIARDEILARYL